MAAICGQGRSISSARSTASLKPSARRGRNASSLSMIARVWWSGRLGVADEQLWPAPSLDLAAGIDSSAVALFAERARSVVPHFSLAEADETSVLEIICRRLDGIPLAIELAASRMASMTASDVHDRLDHRFRLLVGSRRGLERHRRLPDSVPGLRTAGHKRSSGRRARAI